jgi:glycosyltransferase involved in cell wall biosynthesis
MKIDLISIILPIHNQADHIEDLVLEYLKVTDNIPFSCEFILVVNNCSDNSLQICQKLAQQNPRISVVSSDGGGWGLAVRLGLEKARGDLICYTNSARTRPQDLQLFLLYGISNPTAVIKASRKIRDSWQRRLGSVIYNLLLRMFFDLPYWDINGTPKIFPKTFDKLLKLKENGDLIDAEFNIICRQESYPVLEVPVVSGKRRGGKSTTSYQSAIVMYWGALDLWLKARKKNQ